MRDADRVVLSVRRVPHCEREEHRIERFGDDLCYGEDREHLGERAEGVRIAVDDEIVAVERAPELSTLERHVRRLRVVR